MLAMGDWKYYCVRKIREKIGDHHIKTVKGVSYKFDI